MYTKEEQKVLQALHDSKNAFKDLFTEPVNKRGPHGRRDSTPVRDQDIVDFNEGIRGLEKILKAKAAERVEKMDLDDYVKEAVKSTYPGADNIQIHITYEDHQQVVTQMEMRPNPYGSGLSSYQVKDTQPQTVMGKKAEEDEEEEEDGY